MSIQPAVIDSAPYILCNEQRQDETIEILRSFSIEGGLHFGFSGWLNYDIMAATKSSRGIICDSSPRMMEFYQIFKERVVLEDGRTAFLQKLQAVFQKNWNYFDNGTLSQLERELTRPGSWLSTNEGFHFIREMHRKNRILYKQLDATGCFDLLQNLQIRTLYTSNIHDWVEESSVNKEAFEYNMHSLIDDDTLYIDAFYPHTNRYGLPVQDGTGPPLRITEGRLPTFQRTRLPEVSQKAHMPLSAKRLNFN